MPTYKDIVYTLTRSSRSKTASIYIERDGSVSVRVPNHLADDEVEAFFVATGTAANVLAIAALTDPWQQVLCHRAHLAGRIIADDHFQHCSQ